MSVSCVRASFHHGSLEESITLILFAALILINALEPRQCGAGSINKNLTTCSPNQQNILTYYLRKTSHALLR